MELFGSSGTRGVVGEDMTPAFIERLAAVAATEWDHSRVGVGIDTRTTGPMLADAACSGITSTGTDVDLVGVVPTPALQDHLAREGIPGCMLTASHNPPEYNGMKLFAASGVELGGDALDRIAGAFEAAVRQRARWDNIGRIRSRDGIIDRYVNGILACLDGDRLREAELTVAMDPGHGSGIESTAKLCRELGCRVVSVNDTPDGRFPGRAPEPRLDQLDDLAGLVRASHADLGVAHDGDADRAMFVDERGRVVDGHTTLAILADACVEKGDVVVTAVNASQRVGDAVEARGGRLERTAIGSARIVEQTQTCQSAGHRVPLAGEGNGGIFLPETRLTRDGALVLGRMLELVAERALSELADRHDEYALVRRTRPYGSPEERARLLSAVHEFARSSEATLDRTDGVRLAFPDGWVLVRPSGTEPVIRITAESSDRDTARRRIMEILDWIEPT